MISRRTTIRKGFRFHPSVEELLCHYLDKKNQGSTDSQITHVIPEIVACKHEPWSLPALVFAMAEFLDKETYHSYTQWYFFSPLHYKYSNSTRSNRTTDQGYWKITGKELVIMARGSKYEIGRKRTLTFYKRCGEQKPKKTDWVMHEYYRTAKGNQIGAFVLCCLKNKSDKFDHDKDAPFFDGGEPGSSSMDSNVEYQAASNEMITEEEEILTYKALGDAVQIPNGKEDTGSCPIDKNELSNCVEGQLDSCNQSCSDMIDELHHDVENLDSLFLQQLPQPHPPQNYYPSTLQSPIYEQQGNVSHSTNVSNCPFGNHDPSSRKKNNISTDDDDDDDELGSNTASNSENQAANEIPEEQNLGLFWRDQPQALLSINGEPRDLFQNNYFIELDDLPSSFEDFGSSLAKFSDTIIDSSSRVSSDRNTEVTHGSVKGYSALPIGATLQCK